MSTALTMFSDISSRLQAGYAMFEIFCPRNMLLRKGGSWWQGPSFMRFHRLETGIGLLSWADPWRGAYRSPQSDRFVWKKRKNVSFGSDALCTSSDPILWIHKAVNHSNPPERVPVRSAVRMATWKEPMQPSRRRRGEVLKRERLRIWSSCPRIHTTSLSNP